MNNEVNDRHASRTNARVKLKVQTGYRLYGKCVCNAHVLTFREFTLSISTLRRKYHIHATIEK